MGPYYDEADGRSAATAINRFWSNKRRRAVRLNLASLAHDGPVAILDRFSELAVDFIWPQEFGGG